MKGGAGSAGLRTEIQYVRGVGPRNAPLFARLGLATMGDLLHFYPRRYEDRRRLPPIGSLRIGESCTVRGRVVAVRTQSLRGGRTLLRVRVADETGAVELTWFNQPWIARRLADYRGEIIAFGAVKDGNRGLEIGSPEFELIEPDDDPEDFRRIVPVYPLTEGLSQKAVRKAVRHALEHVAELEDPLPERIRAEYRFPNLVESVRQVHWPTSMEELRRARERLVFEEFLGLQLGIQMKRAETGGEPGIAFPISRLACSPVGGGLFAELARVEGDRSLWDEVHRMLPFELTRAQKRVIGEIWADMERPHPMNRLIQGDVGSGKTAVAACAILAAVRCGYQAALMAPTEILAEQHALNLRRLFEPLDIRVELLVGKLTARQKAHAAARVGSGQAPIVVGTHALIQESVRFARLGLVIVDEQHRFGVLQRAALKAKADVVPDVLVMTATPIPRTLSMAVYGDLDVSVIDELPPGRRPVKTHWKRPSQRASVYRTVRELVAQGRQAYFVCPMIEESEKMQTQAAVDLHYRLSTHDLSNLRVGLLHGQMKSAEKEEVIERFRRGEIDVLVSTTVIEVGVDVPNATIMVIEDAHRFGLAQLHQLRGRVGRGAEQSYCILIAEATSRETEERLEVLVNTNDGFKIAEKDLEIRGPGDIAGVRQCGFADLRIANLVTDVEWLERAREVAIRIVRDDPRLERPEHRKLRETVRRPPGEASLVTVG